MEIILFELQGIIITANENTIETKVTSKTKYKNPLDEKFSRANKVIGAQL